MVDQSGDQILGVILFAAISPEYTVRSIVFTDREVVQIPVNRMNEVATKLSGLPVIAAWLLEAANPATFSGLGGLAGMRMWSNLKKKIADFPPVKIVRGPLPSGLLEEAKVRLDYDEIKQVKISKIMMSSDYLLNLAAGYWKTEKIIFEERALQDVTTLIKETPLASKM